MFDKTKPKEEVIRTINGSFSFKGEDIYGINTEFFNWCKETEKKFNVILLNNRVDYSGHWPTDRTRVDNK